MSDPLSIAETVVGIASLGITVTKGLIGYYDAFRGLNEDVAHTSKKLSHLLSLLEQLHAQLKQRPSHSEDQPTLDTIQSSIEDCKDLISELETELDKLKNTPQPNISNTMRSLGRRLAYPLRHSTLQKLNENVDEFVLCASLAMQLILQSGTGRIQDEVEEIKDLLHLVRTTQIASDIRDWLNAPDASIDFNEVAKKRHAKTGLWFVEGSEFKEWLEAPCSFLWLVGFAGCGKSVLCSTAIQYAFRYRKSRDSIGIAFFFFAFNDESKQDVSSMLRSLIVQLSSQLGSESNPLMRLRKSYREVSPPNMALIDCLHQLIRQFSHVYIILDALDESLRDTHREAVLQTLTDIRAWVEPGLHLMATSRNELDINEALQPLPEQIIKMKNSSIDSDIALYISQNLRDSPRLRKWRDYNAQIEQVLTRQAEGVFRWVECQFRALATCPQSEHLLEKLLQSLPRNLEDTYEMMLRNIPSSCIDYAQQMLTLLCCAMRPLSVEELVDGMSIELDDTPWFNPKRRLNDRDAVQLVCPGFTEFSMDPDTEVTTVRIAHFSVQEYLESEQLSKSNLSNFSVRKQQAEDQLPTGKLRRTLLASPPRSQRPKFHNKATSSPTSTGDSFQRWVGIWNIDNFNNETRIQYIPGRLYYSSYLGLTEVCRELLHGDYATTCSDDSDINSKAGYYGTAVQAASVQGHTEIVQLLLKYGANVTTEAGYFGTALQAASAQGNAEIVNLLLSSNHYIKNTAGYYGSALQAATTEGNSKIILLLLRHGVDINMKSGHYGTALQTASAEGNTAIVLLLLQNGSDINGKAGYFGTALQAASAKGNTETVKALLDQGADVNSEAGYYGNALQAASRLPYTKIAQLLIEKGACVNLKSGRYGTALQAASAEGRIKIVSLLIEKGADVDIEGGQYGTALQAASAHGHTDVVRFLLEKNTSTLIEGGYYGTALQAASVHGYTDIVMLLLEKGICSNAPDEIHAAAGNIGTHISSRKKGKSRDTARLVHEEKQVGDEFGIQYDLGEEYGSAAENYTTSHSYDLYKSGSSAATHDWNNPNDDIPNYDTAAEGEDRHVSETIDPRYVVHASSAFQPGEIFKVYWSEPKGKRNPMPSISDHDERISQLGQLVLTGFRRFIIIANDQGHCTCIPILTYENKGCTKRGVKADKHGIIHDERRKPKKVPGEPFLGFNPVRAVMNEQSESLARESRVNYSRPSTIEHNALVWFIGRIHPDDWITVKRAYSKCWEKKMHHHHRR